MTIAREYDFIAARRRLEAKPKSAGPKLGTLEDAAAARRRRPRGSRRHPLLPDPAGARVGLLRRRPRGLTLSRNLMCYEGEWCMVAGAVEQIVTSWMGIGLRWGLSRILREFTESGRVEFEEWSHLGLGLRFRAGPWACPSCPRSPCWGRTS